MFSDRVKKLNPSPIIKYNEDVKKREEEGIFFYKLNIGQPNIKTDKLYFKTLANYKEQINSYSEAKGLEILRKSVSDYYNNKMKNNKFISDNVLITQGASDAIIKLLFSICDKDDEVIILEPFFSDYKIYCDLSEVNIKTISYSNITKENLKKSFSDKTKAILFSNPNNPDGRILTSQDIDLIINFASDNNLFIISDEVYSELVFTNNYISLSRYDYPNIIIVDSASKKLNLCGSRIGFIISKNKELISKVLILNDSKISISNIEQIGVNALLINYKRIAKYSRTIYKKRLNKLINLLENSVIKYTIPQGGMSVLLELPFENCDKYVEWLINNYNKNNCSLLVTQGTDFYLSNEGKNKIRVTLTMNDKDINNIVNILIDSCAKFAINGG